MFEVRKETTDGVEYSYIHFADRPSLYYPGCIEKWEVVNEEAGDGYGYIMFCTVYAGDKEMFCDSGETYELWYNAHHNIADYKTLWKACKKALKLLGITDMKIEED